MVMVAVGVYARLMKHAGELQVSIRFPNSFHAPSPLPHSALPLLLPSGALGLNEAAP
jgi:hypothetical protein